MLLKNSPWAAGVHSLSAVRPWGQGRREGEMERKTGNAKETADRCRKKNCGKMRKNGEGLEKKERRWKK